MKLTTRRNLLRFGSAALAAAPFAAVRLASAATPLSFVSFGGTSGEVYRKHWLEPFTAETGIPVDYVAGPDLAKVKAQVASNNILWDVVDGFGLEAAKEGLAEPIDYKMIDASRFLVPTKPAAVPLYGYVGGVGYDPKRSKAPPRNFAQFWDLKAFPGRRALRNRVREMMEMALIADGVPLKRLYPLDVERGFRSLDRIKPEVKKWFAETAQGVSLVQTGEVDYTYTYLNRVIAAKESGVSIDLSMDQNIIAFGWFFVPRGNPRKEAAMRLLEFISRPQQQAAQSTYMKGLAPAVKGIERLVSPAVLQVLPSTSNPANLYLDDEYWGNNFVAIDKRFKEWTLS